MPELDHPHELSLHQQLEYVRTAAKRRKRQTNERHKSALNSVARQLGYEGYDHLRQLIDAEFDRNDTTLFQASTGETPDPARDYYFFTKTDMACSCYSHWTGWDQDGYELREASLIHPEFFIKLIRDTLQEPLHVIHDVEHLIGWMFRWKGKAVVDATLLREIFPSMAQPRRSYHHGRLPESDLQKLTAERKRDLPL